MRYAIPTIRRVHSGHGWWRSPIAASPIGYAARDGLRRAKGESGLVLNLVYNPQGPTRAPAQAKLEADYKRELGQRFGKVFNRLYTLTNMPIQRFGSTLVSKGQFNAYMTLLRNAYLEANLDGVMCRSLLSVDWQGFVYDCDFNQMLGLPLMQGHRPRSTAQQPVGDAST